MFLSLAPTKPLQAQAVSSHDWPHLRGPHYDGVSLERDLADAWPPDGPPILWTCELGQGYSGFAVVGGKAFTQFQQLGGQYLICFNADSGREIWRLRYDAAWQRSGAYPGPYASPTCSEGRVYFASPSGLVGAADAAGGRLLWSRNLLRDFQGRGAGFGFACTPLVEDELVIFPVGGPGASLVALHAHDGSTAWQTGDDPASYCPALPITWRGQRLVVGYLRNALILCELKTGRLLARLPLSSDYDEHSAWPLYREPDLMLAAPFRLGAQLLRLESKDDALMPRVAWAAPQLSNDVMSSVLLDGNVYGFDLKELQARIHRSSRGEFRCLDFTSGKVRWSTDELGHASLIAADGKLILLDDAGTLILAKATPDNYEELARHPILQDGDRCWTPPVLAGGRLFLRNHHRAVCVYVGRTESLTPEQRERATTAAALPAVGAWDWTWLIGREPEFPNDAPSWSELATWFTVSCVLMVIAACAALAVALLTHLLNIPSGPSLPRITFWSAAFVLGIVATPAMGHWGKQFVWTWPLALYVVFQTTLQTIVWAEAHHAKQRARWLSRLMVIGLLICCWAYYSACQHLGLMTVWAFLIGFLPAWPLAVAAARRQSVGRQWQHVLCVILAFCVYYWTGGAFIAWKTTLAEVWEHT